MIRTVTYCAASVAMMLLLAATPAAWAAERATSFMLANGLQLVVIPDHRLPVVTHMVYYRAGSADDPPGQSGIAHYLEHLMFKGTTRYPTGQYDRIVTLAGGANNAYTSTDKTYYYEQILAEALPRIMDLDADRMAGLAFADREAVSELKVIAEERQGYDSDPESVLAQAVGRTLYGTAPYAHPVLGEPLELQRLTLQQALAFHRRHYGPSTAIVVVAGDVDPDSTLKLAEATYGRLPPGPTLEPRALDAMTAPACPDGRIEQRSSRMARAKVSFTYLTPGTARLGPQTAAALELLADSLQSEVTSPIWDDLVTRRRLATDIAVSHDLRIASGEFSITLAAADGIAPPVLEQGLRDAMRRLLRTGIDAAALATSKQQWLAREILSSDDQLGVATRYGEDLASGRTLPEIEGEAATISAVTLADVNGVLNRYLPDRCNLTAVLAPSEKGDQADALVKPGARPATAVH